MTCQSCHESCIIFSKKRGLCRRCAVQILNRNAIARLNAGFRPKDAYNRYLFELYLKSLLSRNLKNCDITVAKKWAAYLESNQVARFQWGDILDLSENLAIRYSHTPSQGCPVLRTAYALVKAGELPTRTQEQAIGLRKNIAAFPVNIRPIVEVFKKEISCGRASPNTIRITLGAILRFHQFCSPHETLWTATVNTAQRFLEQLPPGVSYYSVHWSILKRFYRWANQAGHCAKNPFEEIVPDRLIRKCSRCGKQRIFRTHSTLCQECYNDRRYRKLLTELKQTFQAKSPYNQQLFDLYTRYIERLMLQSSQHRATLRLKEFLESKEIPVIRSWTNVVKISKEFSGFTGGTSHAGCPFVQIGRMLQEIGVLPIREEDFEIYLLRVLARLGPEERPILTRYSQWQLKFGRTHHSAVASINVIQVFLVWLKHRDGTSLLTVTEPLAMNYLDDLTKAGNLGVKGVVLARFYNWAKHEKLILHNPFSNVVSPKSKLQLTVCSNHQIHKLQSFIKCKNSEPELALMLGLVLFWGFTARDLAWAAIEISEGNTLKIILHRGKKSYQNRTHRRDQTLVLPRTPAWLQELQYRYIQRWKIQFENITMSFPRQPLILNKHGSSNRPLRTQSILERFHRASVLATGVNIPLNVVRRTCGHIHSMQGDASILARMGWSKNHTSNFLWRPRVLYSPSKSKIHS